MGLRVFQCVVPFGTTHFLFLEEKMKKSFFVGVLIMFMLFTFAGCRSKSETVKRELMQGFAWGQSIAQVEKNIASHQESGYTILGRTVGIPAETISDKDEAPLLRWFFTDQMDNYDVKYSDDHSDGYSHWQTEYNEILTDAIKLLGAPDRQFDYRSVWYIDDDIVTLQIERCRVDLFGSPWVIRYFICMDIEHTS